MPVQTKRRTNFVSLADAHPEIASTWHPDRNGTGPRSTPDAIPTTAADKIWWRCPAGHEWQQSVITRCAMSKWKNGDIAACPDCAQRPDAKISHTYPGCGCTREVTRRSALVGYQTCWECSAPERAQAKLERKRKLRRESYHRRKNQAAMPDDERHAQRCLIGFTNYAQPFLTPDRAAIYWPRPFLANSQGWEYQHGLTGSAALDIAQWMQTLVIPHRFAVVADGDPSNVLYIETISRGQLAAVTRRTRGAVTIGPAVHIEHLDDLGRWLPSLARDLRAALAQVEH